MNTICPKLKEKCGVIGVYNLDSSPNAAAYICEGLYALQHRGQESAGIHVYAEQGIIGHKAMGMVEDVFDYDILSKLDGHLGVGHVRYSTTAKSTLAEAQPLYYESPKAKFALAFNGTVSNYLDIKKQLEKIGHSFITETDTEVLAHLIAENLNESDDYTMSLTKTLQIIDGACSLTLVNDKGELYAMRDQLGFKPLSIGQVADKVAIIASESAAIETAGGEFQGDIAPGEIVKVSKNIVERIQAVESPRHAHCMFEYVYFARPDSVLNGINVYEARYRLGRNLAKQHPVDVDAVVPIPDSGRTAAVGYADELGKPMVEGLIKNRYIWRTFIMPGQDVRELSVKLKLNPVRALVEGKNIALIDDSIVRGTTMRRIVRLLKNAGAKAVHVRISCPPIISGCYMGIDFPTRGELMAATKTVEEIAQFIEADSLGYQTLDGLVNGIGCPKNELCLACLTGEYPLKKQPDLTALEIELGGRR